MDVKVHEWGVEGQVMLHRAAIESWTTDKWGQPSVQIAEWLIEDDIVQAFIRLQRGALIIDATIDETGHLRCKNHLHIPFDQWNPGSIQANRTRDSRVRFRHRHAEIVLSARFRAPEWGQALLEEWLMAQRGEETRGPAPVHRQAPGLHAEDCCQGRRWRRQTRSCAAPAGVRTPASYRSARR